MSNDLMTIGGILIPSITTIASLCAIILFGNWIHEKLNITEAWHNNTDMRLAKLEIVSRAQTEQLGHDHPEIYQRIHDLCEELEQQPNPGCHHSQLDPLLIQVGCSIEALELQKKIM